MRRQWGIAIIALVIVFGGIFAGRWLLGYKDGGSMGPPAVSVAVAVARKAQWEPDTRVVGSLSAVDGTRITAQIAGNIMAIAFQPGSHVAKGALLVQLDDSSQRAQLHADEARLAVARTQLQRARALRQENAASESALQSAEADYGSSLAAVEGDRATLAKLRITAPFAGVVGVRTVSTGQYVPAGTPIVQLQRLDPLYLNFSLPQELLPRLKAGDAVRFTIDAYPGEQFAGRVTALDASVDPTTRNIAAQALLRNGDGRLRPGLYGAVALKLGAPLAGVELPETAIAYSSFGDTVYVVQSSGTGQQTAHARHVDILASRDGRVLLGKGVHPGETIVSVGQNKLRDGARVVVSGATRAKADAGAGGQ